MAVSWLICPDCHTLVPETALDCSHCGFALEWIHSHAAFVDRLRQWAGRSPELHLIATWPLGSTELLGSCEAPLELAVAGRASYRFHVEQPDWKLVGEGGSTDQPLQWSLPCRAEMDGLHLIARLRAARQSTVEPPHLDDYRSGDIKIPDQLPVTLGRARVENQPHHEEIDDAHVDPQHCLLQRQASTGDVWIVDGCSEQGTFVNQQPVVAARLRAGDVLQLGAFAWIYNQADGFLVPVRPLVGASLEARELGLQSRLSPLDLSIPPGQFVGIAGSSGAGKSTLMSALLGAPCSRDSGNVWVGGIPCDEREAFRRQLGYVSQREVVLGDLPAVEAIQFSAQLRNQPVSAQNLAQLLRQLDLPEELWRKKPGRMSGGEGQRVRIAAELVACPPLLLMDEPAKGLDLARETALMKRLRTLALQGCTVIVITHGLQHLDYFDRVLLFDKHEVQGPQQNGPQQNGQQQKGQQQGRLRFDGSPEQLKRLLPGGQLAELDFNNLPVRIPATGPLDEHEAEEREATSDSEAGEVTETKPASSSRETRPLRRRGFEAAGSVAAAIVQQTRVLFRREMSLARYAPLRRLAMPLLVVPAIFAVALHLAVPSDKLHLLGFLSVISSIWMGASLSLMAIAGERAVLDHESLLFLRLPGYLIAKWLALALFSVVQSGVFLLLLVLLRTGTGGEMLQQPAGVLLVLILVGWASTGLGLFLSALSGARPLVANFLLPLVILVQIVFSVQVATEHSGQSLHVAYGEFNWQRCRGRTACPLRAIYHEPQSARWLCDRCRTKWRQVADTADSPAAIRERLDEQLAALDREDDKVIRYNQKRPRPWSVVVSWFTISRYGDMALRGFAYDQEASLRWKPHGYGRWVRDAIGVILLQIVGFPLATWLLLGAQISGRLRPLESFFEHSFKGMLGAVLFVVLVGPSAAAAAQVPAAPPEPPRVKIVLPLRDGAYAREDLQRQLNEKLDTRYRIAKSRTWLKLQRSDRLALQLAAAAGLLEVEIEADQMTLLLKADAAARRKLEAVFPVWGLVAPEELNTSQPAVLLVHGLESSPQAFNRWAAALVEQDVSVLYFDYPNDGPLTLAGQRLGKDLRALQRQHPGLKLTIVAHSMGGLVTRYCLEASDRAPTCVRQVFFLGTPHRGSSVASGQQYLEMISRLLPAPRKSKWTTMNDGQGEAAADLKPGSPFLQRLAKGRKPDGVRYFAAAGTQGVMTTDEATALAEQLGRIMTRRKTPAERRDLILEFARAHEWQTGIGDGAVTVQSATLSSAENRKFELDHLSMLRLPGPDPARHPVFLWVMQHLRDEP